MHMNYDDPEIKDLEKQIEWLKGIKSDIDWQGDGDPTLLSSIDKASKKIDNKIDELHELKMQLLCD